MTEDATINAIEPDEIHYALSQMFASDLFRNSERMQQFLRYIVIETLEGRADRIKSYSIAVEVFGRNTSFDSAEDPIVRTTATRLRALLDRYNQTSTHENGVVITLPKGRYVPEFQRVKVQQALAQEHVAPHLDQPAKNKANWFSARFPFFGVSRSIAAMLTAIIVTALVGLIAWPSFVRSSNPKPSVVVIVRNTTATAGSDSAQFLARDFSELLVGKLASHGGVKTIDASNQTPEFVTSIAKSRPSDDIFTFDSLVRAAKSQVSVHWKLNDARTGVVVWASEDPVKIDAIRDPNAVADAIAGRLVGLEGAIPTVLSIIYGDKDDRRECLSKPQRIAFIYHSALQKGMRECLESVVATHPNDAEAWGVLAQLYHRLARNAASFGQDPTEYSDLLSAAAKKSVEIAPQSFLAMQAAMYAAYDRKDLKTFEIIARRILDRFHDPHLKIRIGNAFSFIGLDDEGIQLTKEGIEEAGELQGIGYLSLGYERYVRGDLAGALEMLNRVNTDEYYFVPLLRAITFAQLGRTEEANDAVRKLHELRPAYEKNLYFDFHHNNFAKPIIDSIAEGLRKAGLEVIDPDQQAG